MQMICLMKAYALMPGRREHVEQGSIAAYAIPRCNPRFAFFLGFYVRRGVL